MKHHRGFSDVQLSQPSICTIGVFDGVHRGHQHLVRRLAIEARRAGQLAVVITFDPHPDVVLRKLTGRYSLTTVDERAALLGALGVDHVITLPFDDELRQIRAAAFVDQLLEHLRMERLWVGTDFALGYQREGNVAFLQGEGARRGFTVQTIDLLEVRENVISSTLIRDLLSAGNVDSARDLLGRAYAVGGEVVHGQARGRAIGFPTANLDVWEGKIIPANGVYAGWATFADQRYMAVTNVGLRPTFNGEGITVEAHLLDFDGDLYGQWLDFTFESRLRPEQRFSGIDALIAQIRLDSDAARAYLVASEAVR